MPRNRFVSCQSRTQIATATCLGLFPHFVVLTFPISRTSFLGWLCLVGLASNSAIAFTVRVTWQWFLSCSCRSLLYLLTSFRPNYLSLSILYEYSLAAAVAAAAATATVHRSSTYILTRPSSRHAYTYHDYFHPIIHHRSRSRSRSRSRFRRDRCRDRCRDRDRDRGRGRSQRCLHLQLHCQCPSH